MGTVAKVFYMFATVFFLCAQNNDLLTFLILLTKRLIIPIAKNE